MIAADIEVVRPAFALRAALHAEAGRVVALLGPNGAGKTTVLQALAGHIGITAGRIEIAGRVVDEPARRTFVAPEQRQVGYVHQQLLLFPHLSVRDNVAFGLVARGDRRGAARARADELLAVAGLADLGGRRPRSLSGGQAQQVALARALAVEPPVLLLDEPLSALDASVRGATRRRLRQTLEGFAGAAVVVTHDPVDALTLADDVVVLEAGSVAQAGTLAEVTQRPRTRHVADLLGVNLVAGTGRGTAIAVGGAEVVVAEAVEGPAFVTIAPSAVTVHGTRPEGSARNRWAATVGDIEPLGERIRVHLAGELPLVAEITPAALADLGLQEGDPVWASVKATEIQAYPR